MLGSGHRSRTEDQIMALEWARLPILQGEEFCPLPRHHCNLASKQESSRLSSHSSSILEGTLSLWSSASMEISCSNASISVYASRRPKQHFLHHQHQQLFRRRQWDPAYSFRSQPISLNRSCRVLADSLSIINNDVLCRLRGADKSNYQLRKWQLGCMYDHGHLPLPNVEKSLDGKFELESVPEYPDAVQALCWTYVASCLVERAWRFALPALLALLSDNLLLVALNSFVSQLVVFVGGPLIGAFLDSKSRLFSFSFLSIMQTVSILVSGAMILYASRISVPTSSTLSLIMQPWYSILVIASAVDRITGISTGVAFERDWVVLLVGQTRTAALAEANAMLRRVDLICDIIGPFLFGLALSKYRPDKCILMTCVTAAVSLPILIVMVKRTYSLSNGVLDRPKDSTRRTMSLSVGLKTFTQGWSQYLSQPILPASIAYVLLSLNAILAPSGLMTTFLTQRGLNPAVIGTYRGLCAAMGFLATYLGATLIARIGSIKAGFLSLSFQAFLLSLSVLLYFVGPIEKQTTLYIFLTLVVLSRLGHWAYDMVIAQIIQTAVPQSVINVVSSAEMSLASFAELLMLALAIVVKDVSHFGTLSLLSMLSVAGAAGLYWTWLRNPMTESQLEHVK